MYERLKAKDGALDFVDLLLVARNLVRKDRQVREGFQQRFKRIFVDEFQDTDPLQAEILLLIAADDPNETDWRKARPLPGHLFLVGDPKQSIYRFRGADVAIYREVTRRAPEWGATLVHLTTSFRSVPELQSFVNAAFTSVMTGDDLTLQAKYVPLARPSLVLPSTDNRVSLRCRSLNLTRHTRAATSPTARSTSPCPRRSAPSSTGSSTKAIGT